MTDKSTGIPLPQRRITRSLADKTANPDDIPTPVGPSGSQITPQQPRTLNRPPRLGNESLATMDSTCERHADPLDNRLSQLETTLPRLNAAIEDSLARLSLMESSAAKIDRLDDIETALKGLEEMKASQTEMTETLKGILAPVHTLQKDMNKVLEDASETRRTAVEQQEDYHVDLTSASKAFRHGTSSQRKPVTGKTRSSKRKMKPSPRSGTSRRYHDDASTTSEESDEELIHIQREDTTDEEKEAFVPFFKRSKGPKFPGLCSITVSDKRYDKLMSYRYYRLYKIDQRRNAEATSKLSRLLKSLDLTFREHKFSGAEPILVFDFLTRIVEEADMLSITEGQLFVLLPHLLNGDAASQYRATVKGSRSNGVTCWPEAVQYFLRTYATTNAIRDANHAFRGLKQILHEDEVTFSARVNLAAFKCGNVHDEDEKITVFIDGLNDSVRTVVARFRDNEPRYQMTYERLVQYAKDEGDSYRARLGIRQQTTRTPTRLRPTARSPPSTPMMGYINPDLEATQESVYLHNEDEGTVPSSVNTSELPSTLTEEEQEQLLFLQTKNDNRGKVFPPRVAQDPRRQVGWIDQRSIICYGCYEHNHIMPDCKVQINQFDRVISNYEKLTVDQKARVPDKSYKLAKLYVQKDAPTDPKVHEPSKGEEQEPKNG